MARRRRYQEHENLERWLISYADFITLLFAFFVVMYAISSLNEGKYRVLSDTLMSAFNNPPKSVDPIEVGKEVKTTETSVVPMPEGHINILHPGVEKQPQPEKSTLDQLRDTAQSSILGEIAGDFEKAMMPQIQDDMINIKRDQLWVEVEINTALLFTSGSARLQPEATPVLSKLARVLKKYPNHLQVEGFTDNLPINTLVYPSNWELSAARAASVVHLFMNEGVDPDRMAALGFGQYQPIASNDTPEGRRKNRRVVVVILADANARRALEVQRSRGTGMGTAQ